MEDVALKSVYTIYVEVSLQSHDRIDILEWLVFMHSRGKVDARRGGWRDDDAGQA
jgi:hypothetical protein